MGKAVKVGGIALALLLLMSAFAVYVPESQWTRSWVESQMSQRLEGREVAIDDISVDWGWPPLFRVEGVHVANTDWAEHDNMIRLDALELVPDMGQLLSGQIGLKRLDLERPRMHLARRADGISNWGTLIWKNGNNDLPMVPQTLTINGGHVTYRDEQLDIFLDARIATAGNSDTDRRLTVKAEGSWQGNPLNVTAWGAAPLQALDADSAYPLQFDGNLGELQVSFIGQAQDPLQPQVVQGTFDVSAPADARVAALLGYPDAVIPGFHLQGQLKRDGPRWTLESLELESAQANLDGTVTLIHDDPLQLELDLDADRIDLNRWDVFEYFAADQPDQPSPRNDNDLPLAERLTPRFEMLRGRQVKIDLTIDELIYGDQSLQNLNAIATLDEQRVNLKRLQARQGDGRLRADGELALDDNAVVGEVNAALEQFHLGEALEPIRSTNLGMLDGNLHARFRKGVMTLHDTEVVYDSPAQDLSIHLQADTRELPDEPVPGLHAQGSGIRYGEPFRFNLDLGPLLDLTEARKPYPVKGTLGSRDSSLYVDGTIVRPLALGTVDTQFRLEGPNPDRINAITRLSLPSLPPYHIEGRLRWHDGILRLSDFAGVFGESDLAGDLRLRTGERAMVWATLHSRSLDYDDLRPLWGSPPGTGPGEVASQEQERRAREQKQTGRIFSAKPWSPEALRRMDAKVILNADHVNAKGLPLQELELELDLQQGVMVLRPVVFGLGGGTVDSNIRIDAGQDKVVGQLESAATGVNLTPLLRTDFPQVAKDSAGVIGGKADLSFAGKSVADFMAGANGQLELAMSGGQLDTLALELLGLDAGEALVAALVDADQVPIRCAYLRFRAEQGQVDLEQLFMDTDDSNFTGAGEINLATEQLNLRLDSHPKDASIFTANSPVLLRGTLVSPSVEVTSAELLARTVTSLIGLAVAPPLAILPWVDPGMGEGVGPGCQQVLSEFRAGQ